MLPKTINRLRVKTGLAAALTGIATISSAGPIADVAVVGPLNSASCAAREVRILGIDFQATNSSSAALVCKLGTASSLTYVSANGRLTSNGSVDLLSLRIVSRDGYVPGASPVYLQGTVTASNAIVGSFSVGGAVFSSSGLMPSVGEPIEVVGVQPLLGGVILSTQLETSSGMDSFSSIGSGASANSSIGSGSSANSSIGSGASALSSIGSGSSANSSIGSGVAANSSIGSGKSKQSSIGSGAAASSSIGSGASANSSIGSGKSTQSSIGSGVSANSSIGSGALANSSIGSGKSKQSSIGSGVSANSSIGSGVALMSSIGSGAQ